MELVKLLQTAIDYMEEHLLEDINYENVAKQVYMSSYNFHRTFTLMAGMSANEYIRNRRLSMAAQELLTTDHKVIDVAYTYGYDTPESFAKAFARFHGVTPRQAKEKGTQLHIFNRLVIKITLEGGKIMDYRVEDVGTRRFIVLARQFSNDTQIDEANHTIPEFWKECNNKKMVNAIRELRPDGKKDLYGLCGTTKENEDTFTYAIGVVDDEDTKKISEEELTANGFQIWTISTATYVVFNCYGDNGECITNMWSYFFKEFLPQSKYEYTDEVDYEIYFEKGEPGLFCELWIPVKLK